MEYKKRLSGINPQTLIKLTRFEMFKAVITRGNQIRFAIGIFSPLLLIWSFWATYRNHPDLSRNSENLQNAVHSLSSSALLLATISGVYFASAELRSGAASYSLVYANSRAAWIFSKTVTAVTFGFLLTLIAEVEVVGLGSYVLHSLHVSNLATQFQFNSSEIGFALSGIFGSLIGVGVGLLIKNQITGVLLVVVYTLGLDPLMLSVLPKISRYFIGGGYESIANDLTQPNRLPIFIGYMVLAIWTIGFMALGSWRMHRADIQWKEV